MTLYGLIAAALCCGTVIFLSLRLSKHPLYIIRKNINVVEDKTPAPAATTAPEKTEADTDVEIKNMDAVISAANALMGIGLDDGGAK